MKDLDFDELDRAVNSLLTNNKPNEEGTLKDFVEAPTVADDAPVSVPRTIPTPPLAARRSSGRFMDVVHPSSDMRSTMPVPQRPISREGLGIAPLVREESDSLVVPEQTPSLSSPEREEPVENSESTASEWPDPLDFNGFSQHQSEDSPEPVAEDAPSAVVEESIQGDDDKDINQIADEIDKTLGGVHDEAQNPLESPFLTDAKVEKRPLGAFSMDPPVSSEVPLDMSAISIVAPEIVPNSEDATPKHEDNPPEEVPLPAELQDALLSIESDTDTSGQLKKEEPTALPTPLRVDASAGAASIPQQYTEQPSTGDQPTGAIFDTRAYQKPLAHPAKKKSGWLMVLWIVLLLMVGAGAGAAVYFFVLPLL